MLTKKVLIALLISSALPISSARAQSAARPEVSPTDMKARYAAELDKESGPLRETAELRLNNKSSEAAAKESEIVGRIANRLGLEPTDQRLRSVVSAGISHFLTQISIQKAREQMLAMPHLRGLVAAPDPKLKAELEREAPAISAAAAKPGMQARATAVKPIAARVAQRLGKPATDPGVYSAVLRAIQIHAQPGDSQRVMASLQGIMPTDLGKSFSDLEKVDSLVEEGKIDEAVAILKRNATQTDRLLAPLAIAGTADMLRPMQGMLAAQKDFALGVATKAPTHEAAIRYAFEVAATRKAQINEVERRISFGLAQTDPKLRANWLVLLTQIAAEEFQQAQGQTLPNDRQEALAKALASRDQSERLIASKAKGTRAEDARAHQSTVIQDLQRQLGPKEALVSYFHHESSKKNGTTVTTSSRIAAFVMKSAALHFVDLGDATPIEAGIKTYLKALDELDHSPASLQTKQTAASELYQRIFAPLAPHLSDVRLLRVAADSAIQTVPLAALYDGKDWLVDSFQISYLSSERDLLDEYRGTGAIGSPLVVGWSPAGPAAKHATGPLTPNAFAHLDGVAEEAAAIGAMLPRSRVLVGDEATDMALVGAGAGHGPSPGVLHVAAHGVYLDTALAAPGTRGIVRLPTQPPSVSGSPEAAPAEPVTNSVDPLINSALVLNPSSSTDGFLTAYEVAGLGLFNTELTVLSACETGRGTAGYLEGVRGMRAAFFAAGTETLVVSLWQVRDEPTTRLMKSFYARLAQKKGRSDALHEAMLESKKASPDPSHWAAFILLGRTDPMVTFGAPRAATKSSEAIELERKKRGIAFQNMERGRGTGGSGSWKSGEATDTLLDSSVRTGLGPNRSNMILNLLGDKSAISILIEGYHGAGRYIIGPRKGEASIRGLAPGTKPSVSSLHPSSGAQARSGEIVLVPQGNNLTGSFKLSFGGKTMTGSFVIPGR